MTSGMPIKRSPHIAALSRDHHHALLLGWKIRQGIKLNREVSRICAYVVHFYKKYVEQHFMAEETLLFHQLPDGDELNVKKMKTWLARLYRPEFRVMRR